MIAERKRVHIIRRENISENRSLRPVAKASETRKLLWIRYLSPTMIKSFEGGRNASIVGIQNSNEISSCLSNTNIYSSMLAFIYFFHVADRKERTPRTDQSFCFVGAAIINNNPLKVFESLKTKALINTC